jgi:hypothetical protein
MVDVAILCLFLLFMFWPVLTLQLIYKTYGKMATLFSFLLWTMLMGGYIWVSWIALSTSKKILPVNSVAAAIGQMTVSTEALGAGVVVAAILGLIFIVTKIKMELRAKVAQQVESSRNTTGVM